MKNPLKNKISFNQIWLFDQNLIGYLANFRLVIRLTSLTKAHALFYIFHPVRWCLVVDVAYELFLHLDVVSGAYNVIIPFFDSHKMRPDIQSYRKPSMPDLLL